MKYLYVRINSLTKVIFLSVIVYMCILPSLEANAAPSKPDTLDALLDAGQQWECGLDKLDKYEREALARTILSVYRSGQRQEFSVTSSYGSFTASLVEYDGSRFIFELNPIEMSRLKRALPDLEWLPDTRLALYPYQVSWLRR